MHTISGDFYLADLEVDGVLSYSWMRDNKIGVFPGVGGLHCWDPPAILDGLQLYKRHRIRNMVSELDNEISREEEKRRETKPWEELQETWQLPPEASLRWKCEGEEISVQTPRERLLNRSEIKRINSVSTKAERLQQAGGRFRYIEFTDSEPPSTRAQEMIKKNSSRL